MPWPALELIHRLSAVPAIWRRHLGEHFDPFKRAFLIPRSTPARHFPCSRCGCSHEIVMPEILTSDRSTEWKDELRESLIHREKGTRGARPSEGASFRAVCSCESWNCPDLLLSPADIQILELNWPKLARALSDSFGLNPRFADLHIFNTAQIGSWSADAVPAILTIQSESYSLRSVICELVARLRRRFILLSPTSNHLDATCHELLANADAGFFALENLVTFDGSLRLVGKLPGELFARFSAQPKEAEQDVARRAFALIKSLDSESAMKPPSLLAVFRLYCVEELSAEHIARIQHCSKATIISRLNQIRARTGVDPQDLRKISGHLKKIEEDMHDSRASHIHRKKMIYDAEG